MASFEQTGLWSRAFGPLAPATDRPARDRLVATYRQLWQNAKTLAGEIQKSVPSLTLHDEVHFDALWERADQIAGPDLGLTPLELFVFGAAILFHDNANSVAAFSGGLSELAATSEWADAEREWRDRQPNEATIDPLPEDGRRAVLFETLRALHAQRAETLASLEVAIDGGRVHLLADDGLRRHLGEVIGQIAASHHWDAQTLPDRLPGVVGALEGMPADWRIRPVLLACLLRCADAVQLDQSRAPDFLFGLLKLHGVSLDHWRAQNRLAKPIIDPEDPGALLLTSTMSFPASASDAWWVAYEAIHVANRELQAADALLRDLRLPVFAISRIRGAESPLRLTEQVRVQGWQPVAAKVNISDVAKIVGMFGGDELYGSDYSVPLRELIQNAADAVRIRRQIEPNDSGYNGRILVRLADKDCDFAKLSVEDNGLGMSKVVLTGPLIDFGGRYITSNIIKRERPGLKSILRKGIGRYGIGFFSSFMLADEVSVISKPFDGGREDTHTLVFRNGIHDRPLLIDGGPPDFGALASSRVVLKVPKLKLAEMLSERNGFGDSPTVYTLKELVGVLCPMLDVDVYVDEGDGPERVHRADWHAEDRHQWLTRILAPNARHKDIPESLRDRLQKEYDEAATRLRPIDPNDPSMGVAAIGLIGSSGVRTVSSLRAPVLFNTHDDSFVGAIDFEPAGPRREPKAYRAASLLPAWATDQARLVAASGVTFPDRQRAAERVAEFGGDSSLLFGLQLNGEWVDLENITNCLMQGQEFYAPIIVGRQSDSIKITRVRENHYGFVENFRRGELKFIVPTLEGLDGGNDEVYYYVKNDALPEFGFYRLIQKKLASCGFSLFGEIFQKIKFAEYVGQASPRQGLVPGKEIVTDGLKLSAIPVG